MNIFVTGAPGVGKSDFVNKLATALDAHVYKHEQVPAGETLVDLRHLSSYFNEAIQVECADRREPQKNRLIDGCIMDFVVHTCVRHQAGIINEPDAAELLDTAEAMFTGANEALMPKHIVLLDPDAYAPNSIERKLYREVLNVGISDAKIDALVLTTPDVEAVVRWVGDLRLAYDPNAKLPAYPAEEDEHVDPPPAPEEVPALPPIAEAA